MTPQEFRAIRGRAGLTQAQAARLLGAGLRAVKYWEGGDRAIPGSVAAIMRHVDGQETIEATLARLLKDGAGRS